VRVVEQAALGEHDSVTESGFYSDDVSPPTVYTDLRTDRVDAESFMQIADKMKDIESDVGNVDLFIEAIPSVDSRLPRPLAGTSDVRSTIIIETRFPADVDKSRVANIMNAAENRINRIIGWSFDTDVDDIIFDTVVSLDSDYILADTLVEYYQLVVSQMDIEGMVISCLVSDIS